MRPGTGSTQMHLRRRRSTVPPPDRALTSLGKRRSSSSLERAERYLDWFRLIFTLDKKSSATGRFGSVIHSLEKRFGDL